MKRAPTPSRRLSAAALLLLALAVPGSEVGGEGGDQQEHDHDQCRQDQDRASFVTGAGVKCGGEFHIRT